MWKAYELTELARRGDNTFKHVPDRVGTVVEDSYLPAGDFSGEDGESNDRGRKEVHVAYVKCREFERVTERLPVRLHPEATHALLYSGVQAFVYRQRGLILTFVVWTSRRGRRSDEQLEQICQSPTAAIALGGY